MAAQWKKIAAGALGAVNLGGALYLQNLLSGPAFVGVTLPGYYGFVQAREPPHTPGKTKRKSSSSAEKTYIRRK